MNRVDRAFQCVAFVLFVVLFFKVAIPLVLGTLEQLLGLTGSRRP